MGDDEKQSLQEVSAIGAPNLQADAELWVHVAGGALTITEDKRKWWVQSLRRLHDLRLASLDRFADYVLRTRPLIQDGGLLVCDALDAFVASETTRDFMARLRIGIMADQAPPPDPRDGCPEDIVFSQDVIARHARPEWYPVTAVPVDPALLNPAQ